MHIQIYSEKQGGRRGQKRGREREKGKERVRGGGRERACDHTESNLN